MKFHYLSLIAGLTSVHFDPGWKSFRLQEFGWSFITEVGLMVWLVYISGKFFTSVWTHCIWGKIDFEIFNVLDKSEDSEHFLTNFIFENFYKCSDPFSLGFFFWNFQLFGWIRRLPKIVLFCWKKGIIFSQMYP